MALSYDDISSMTQRHIVPAIVDTVYKVSPLFVKIKANNSEKFEGGTKISHPIMYAKLKGGAFTRGTTFDTSYVQTDTALEVYMKYYYVNVTLFGTDNVINKGPDAAMSLVETKMINASGAMASLLATDFFLDGQGTGSSAIAIDGLAASVDDGSNFTSYGNITRADIGSGANQGINSYYASMASLSLSGLQTAFGSAWFGNEHPDLLVTTQVVWNALWNKIQPQQRFQEESSDVAKIGFQSMKFNGVSLCVDQYCPAGKLYGLNTKYIQFWLSTLPKYQFGFTGFKEAQNSDDVCGQYLVACNLLNIAPRLMFQLSGITG